MFGTALALSAVVSLTVAFDGREASSARQGQDRDYIYCMLRTMNNPSVREVYMSEIFVDDYLKIKETWTNPFWRYVQREHSSRASGAGYCYHGATYEAAEASQQRLAASEERSGSNVIWTIWSN